MAKYEIWNNGIECGKDVANTGSNIKEIWNQGVLWWKKISDWEWLDILPPSVTIRSPYYVVGDNSLLIGNSSNYYILKFENGEITYPLGESGGRALVQRISTITDYQDYQFYYNGYFYIKTTFRNITENCLKISESDGTYEYIDLTYNFYVNGNLFTPTSYTLPNFYRVYDTNISYLVLRLPTNDGTRRGSIEFKSTDFVNYYADDVITFAYSSTITYYYQEYLLCNGTSYGVQEHTSTTAGNYISGINYNPYFIRFADTYFCFRARQKVVNRGIYSYEYDLCSTTDFINYSVVLSYFYMKTNLLNASDFFPMFYQQGMGISYYSLFDVCGVEFCYGNSSYSSSIIRDFLYTKDFNTYYDNAQDLVDFTIESVEFSYDKNNNHFYVCKDYNNRQTVVQEADTADILVETVTVDYKNITRLIYKLYNNVDSRYYLVFSISSTDNIVVLSKEE